MMHCELEKKKKSALNDSTFVKYKVQVCIYVHIIIFMKAWEKIGKAVQLNS